MSDPQDTSDPHDVAHGARLLAIEMTLRTLVKEVSASEPGLRDRVRGTVEHYLSGLEPNSEMEQDFARRARAFTESMLAPLGE